MTPPNPDSPTRLKLMDSAEKLMLGRGYVAASVDAICGEAGVTKGSFFHYFPNKETLGKELLLRFAGRQETALRDACSGLEDPLDRIHRLLDLTIEGARDPTMKGCLVGTLAQEISETHPELREVCQVCFKRFAEGVAANLQEAKDRHCPQAEFNAQSLGAYFVSVIQGAMLLMRTNGDRVAMETSINHLKNYLETLYGR